MKVLDVISEGITSRYIAKEVVDQIAKSWLKEIKLYKQEFGVIPKLDELIDFAPAEKLTKEKAIARDPEIQQKAYKEAIRLFKEQERAKGLQSIDKSLSKAGLKLAEMAGWFAWFLKWGSRLAMVYELGAAWRTYEEQLQLALEDLSSGAIDGPQFKTLHDRILIQFYTAAGATIAVAGIGGLARAGLKGAEIVAALKNGRFIRDIIAVNPADKFFTNLTKSIAPAGVVALAELLDSDWGRQQMVYYLTAEGMEEGGVKLSPTWSGTIIEKVLANTEHFKKKALEAASKGGSADKIPPSVRPKEKQQPNDAQPPAASNAPAAGSQASDDHEEEPPVSGGTPTRPNQGAQAAGTSSDWK